MKSRLELRRMYHVKMSVGMFSSEQNFLTFSFNGMVLILGDDETPITFRCYILKVWKIQNNYYKAANKYSALAFNAFYLSIKRYKWSCKADPITQLTANNDLTAWLIHELENANQKLNEWLNK